MERASEHAWNIGTAIAAPALRLWVVGQIRGVGRTPVPSGPAVAHAAGANPDQVLLIGNGPSLGFGVLTWDLSLAGYLARRLSALTSRGADVEVVARLRMTAASARDLVRTRSLSRHDAAVITIGTNEAMTLSSVRRWYRDLCRLLEHIEAESASEFHTFVVANAPARAGGGVPRLFARMIDRRIRQLNRAAQDAVARYERATFVADVPELRVNLNLYSSASYDGWAAAIAPAMTMALNRASCAARPLAPPDEIARQAALDALGVLDTPVDATIDRLTALARNLFDVTGAAVTFLDRDRLWMKSAAGIPRTEVSRRHSFCDVTIQQSQVFVVEDALLDERFRDHPSVAAQGGIRFYAGYPVRSPEGERIGAFCISDRTPRSLSTREAVLLRDLALQVQRHLWNGPPEDELPQRPAA